MRGRDQLKKKDGDDIANCVFLSVRTLVVKKYRLEINANKKTPEGAYSGCVGVRKNYRCVE